MRTRLSAVVYTLALSSVIPLSAVELQPYGQFRTDVSHDSDGTTTLGYWACAAVSDSDTSPNTDAQTHFTVRGTRLGLNATQDDYTGKLELDFYGAGGETTPAPRIRHAYIKVPINENLEALVGQTWSVISPGLPTQVNEYAGWRMGNTAFRTQQLRLTYTEESLTSTVAISRLGNDADTERGTPAVEARVAYGFSDMTVGVSGLVGEEKNTTGDDVDMHLFAVDFKGTFAESFTVKGEAYVAENAFGIMGIGNDKQKEQGGWINVLYAANQYTFGLGYGTVSVDDAPTGITTASVEGNSQVWANVFWKYSENITVGYELSQITTEYAGNDDGTNIRNQLSITAKY